MQDNQEFIELLKRAAYEIKDLRRQNELKRARLEMFDTMVQILHTTPASFSQGMSPDIVWEIEKTIESNLTENVQKGEQLTEH